MKSWSASPVLKGFYFGPRRNFCVGFSVLPHCGNQRPFWGGTVKVPPLWDTERWAEQMHRTCCSSLPMGSVNDKSSQHICSKCTLWQGFQLGFFVLFLFFVFEGEVTPGGGGDNKREQMNLNHADKQWIISLLSPYGWRETQLSHGQCWPPVLFQSARSWQCWLLSQLCCEMGRSCTPGLFCVFGKAWRPQVEPCSSRTLGKC